MAYPDWTRDAERTGGYMYYPGGGGNGTGGNMGGNTGGNGGINYYTEIPRDMMRDPR